jgi:acetyl-CoA carboxylase, biotin carboxyl carrier protein
MNLEEIRSLVQIMSEGKLTCVEVTEGETKIRLEKQPAAGSACASAAAVPESVPAQPRAAVEQAQGNTAPYIEVESPMVGVFYASPSPESRPFVQIGQKVKKGDVLCVIEAMKLMNELNADADGEIAEICAQNGQIVEYGQTLFKLR